MIDVAVDEGNYERQLEVEIINGRKCENTTTQYRLKVEHFKRWVELKRPLCISADGNVLLHCRQISDAETTDIASRSSK
jgi:hypothetical protein